MATGQPQPITNKLLADLRSCLDTQVHYLSKQDWHYKRLARDCEKLQAIQADQGSICWAMLEHITGDREGGERWLRNFIQLRPDRPDAYHRGMVVILANLGYFDESGALFQAFEPEWVDETSARIALFSAAFTELAGFERGTPFASPVVARAVSIAKECRVILEKLDLTDKDVRRMMNIAGEVMRRHKLFHEGQEPIVTPIRHPDGDALMVEIPVHLDANAAMDLTEELIDALIDQDAMVFGASVTFLPTVV